MIINNKHSIYKSPDELRTDRTQLQKSAYVKFWRLRKGHCIDLQGNLLYEKKKIVKKSDMKRILRKLSSKANLEDVLKLEQE